MAVEWAAISRTGKILLPRIRATDGGRVTLLCPPGQAKQRKP